jgi:hypothetical protein
VDFSCSLLLDCAWYFAVTGLSMVRGKEDNHEVVCGKCNEGLHRENSSAHKCKKYLFFVLFNEDQYGI